MCKVIQLRELDAPAEEFVTHFNRYTSLFSDRYYSEKEEAEKARQRAELEQEDVQERQHRVDGESLF